MTPETIVTLEQRNALNNERKWNNAESKRLAKRIRELNERMDDGEVPYIKILEQQLVDAVNEGDRIMRRMGATPSTDTAQVGDRNVLYGYTDIVVVNIDGVNEVKLS